MKKILGIGLLLIALLAMGASAQRPTYEVYCQNLGMGAYDATYENCMMVGQPQGFCEEIASEVGIAVFRDCMGMPQLQ